MNRCPLTAVQTKCAQARVELRQSRDSAIHPTMPEVEVHRRYTSSSGACPYRLLWHTGARPAADKDRVIVNGGRIRRLDETSGFVNPPLKSERSHLQPYAL